MTEGAAAKSRAGVSVALVRALLLALIVVIQLSTSASIVVEPLICIVLIVSPALWGRILHAMRLPVTLGVLAFAAALAIATLYGAAPWLERLTGFLAWRRIWLVPVAAAVFDDERSKRLALNVMVWSCVLAALASFVTAAGSITITPRLYDGIIFHNYANQGITFSVAASVCIAALMRPQAFAGDRLLGNSWLMSAALAILVIDIVFVLWGRTGYLALLVMAAATVIGLAGGSWRTKAAAGLAVVVCGAVLLAASPNGRNRITHALDEIAAVDQSTEGTQLGVRVVMWRFALRMIEAHPILGVGTGSFREGYRTLVRAAYAAGWRGGNEDRRSAQSVPQDLGRARTPRDRHLPAIHHRRTDHARAGALQTACRSGPAGLVRFEPHQLPLFDLRRGPPDILLARCHAGRRRAGGGLRLAPR